MEITLSLTGDYGVRALLEVARAHGEGRRKTREIAEAMDIPTSYLSQILADLVTAGMLRAAAGRHGGYELTRAPDEILLLDVVEVLDGEITLERCVLRGIECSSDGICAIHDAWSAAQESFVSSLRSVTLADLVERDRELRGDPAPASYSI